MAYHKNVNSHLYDNQLELVPEQLKRAPCLSEPTIDINPDIKTIEDLEKATLDDFTITYKEFHPIIKYPFAV